MPVRFSAFDMYQVLPDKKEVVGEVMTPLSATGRQMMKEAIEQKL
jgi:hypothetical protein